MVNEQIEKERYEEAKGCQGCPNWLKHCNAECCRNIILNVNPLKLLEGARYLTINPGRNLGISDIKYYKLHDVEYVRGLLRFKKERLEKKNGKLIYKYKCDYLKDNLCIGHGKDKPEICKLLTVETAKLPNKKFELTDNCLFKYKCKEGDNNG